MSSNPESPAHCTRDFLFQDLMYDSGYCSSLCLLGQNLTVAPTALYQVLNKIPQKDVTLGLEKRTTTAPFALPCFRKLEGLTFSLLFFIFYFLFFFFFSG